MTKNNHKNWLKILLITAVVIGAGASLLFVRASRNQDNGDTNTSTGDLPERTVNYQPPTDDEKKAGDEQKESTVQNNSQNLPNTAQVVIVDSSQYDGVIEVRAFVSNVIADGTCTVTFTKGTGKVTKSVPAYADASTTPCVNVEVPRTEFAQAGTWDVTVLYESKTVKGSASSKLEVQ